MFGLEHLPLYIGWTWRFTWGRTLTTYKYFKDDEVKGLDPELCAMLDRARGLAGVPFIITSGLRSPDQNASLRGAVSDSAHLTGLAVDMSTNGDDHILSLMLRGLILVGFSRVGLYFAPDPAHPSKLIPHHIHVDIDPSKPPQMTWSSLELNP